MEKDYVFVDTSVFCKANYFVKDGTISHLFQLHDKGRILLLMPTITKREVQKTTGRIWLSNLTNCLGYIN